MVKNKLQRFSEMKEFAHVIQPGFDEAFNNTSDIKGTWKKEIFKNDNPLVVEFGCGKGEYTIGLAKQYPDKNFIGVDIKGARMWVGACQAIEMALTNVRFLRTRIEFIRSFFAENEVDEIWITFPDPQPKVKRTKKRLSSALFLNSYKAFLNNTGKIHLKTDCPFLYQYTSALLKHNNIVPEVNTADLYNDKPEECEKGLFGIKTYYESLFLSKGLPITYLRFSLPLNDLAEIDDDTVKDLLERYDTNKI